MKLYEFGPSPNPRRVRMYLAEKSIEVATQQIDTLATEQFSQTFQKINPRGTIPALELDDGTVITESVSICRYFEELHPEPPLFGRNAREKAIIDMWIRRVDFECMSPAGDVVRNTLEMFKGRAIAGNPDSVPQIPALADRGRTSYARFINRFDEHLAENEFVAGDIFTVADIIAFVTLDYFIGRGVLKPPATAKNVLIWHGRIATRPSAAA